MNVALHPFALPPHPRFGGHPALDRTIVQSRDSAVLKSVLIPETELAVWQRRVPSAFAGTLAATDWSNIDDVDDRFAIAGLETTLDQALAAVGHDATRAPLRAELLMLAAHFVEVMGCDILRIRVNIIDTDACAKFHRDAVAVRLLLTLHGPATQWLDSREGDAAKVYAMHPGDVALMKGRRWSPGGTIQHRSPPIAGTGMRRLVVVMDQVEADAA